MKGLFCIDKFIYVDREGNYYDNTLTKEVLSRYLNVVDELTIAVRIKPINDNSMLEKYSKISLNKIKIIELPNILSFNGMLFNRNKVKQKLSKIIENTDLIFVRTPSFIGNIIIKVARDMEKPYLVEVGGCAWDSYWNHSIKGKIIAPYIFLTTRKAVRNSPFAVYVTEKFLQKRYPSNGETCSCSNVVLKETEGEILLKRIDKIENMRSNQKLVIGTTAAVSVKYKGQQYIIKAISRLRTQGLDIEYQLVGGGDNAYLKEIAEKYGVLDKVKFLGPMKHTDVLEWLDTIDIYAQPSKQEGLPRALIEAMSRGCPSIGSTTAGIPELLSSSMIFSNGDVSGICNKLTYLVNGHMKEQAQANFEKAKNFKSDILEKRRTSFFNNYAKFVRSINE